MSDSRKRQRHHTAEEEDDGEDSGSTSSSSGSYTSGSSSDSNGSQTRKQPVQQQQQRQMHQVKQQQTTGRTAAAPAISSGQRQHPQKVATARTRSQSGSTTSSTSQSGSDEYTTGSDTESETDDETAASQTTAAAHAQRRLYSNTTSSSSYVSIAPGTKVPQQTVVTNASGTTKQVSPSSAASSAGVTSSSSSSSQYSESEVVVSSSTSGKTGTQDHNIYRIDSPSVSVSSHVVSLDDCDHNPPLAAVAKAERFEEEKRSLPTGSVDAHSEEYRDKVVYVKETARLRRSNDRQVESSSSSSGQNAKFGETKSIEDSANNDLHSSRTFYFRPSNMEAPPGFLLDAASDEAGRLRQMVQHRIHESLSTKSDQSDSNSRNGNTASTEQNNEQNAIAICNGFGLQTDNNGSNAVENARKEGVVSPLAIIHSDNSFALRWEASLHYRGWFFHLGAYKTYENAKLAFESAVAAVISGLLNKRVEVEDCPSILGKSYRVLSPNSHAASLVGFNLPLHGGLFGRRIKRQQQSEPVQEFASKQPKKPSNPSQSAVSGRTNAVKSPARKPKPKAKLKPKSIAPATSSTSTSDSLPLPNKSGVHSISGGPGRASFYRTVIEHQGIIRDLGLYAIKKNANEALRMAERLLKKGKEFSEVENQLQVVQARDLEQANSAFD